MVFLLRRGRLTVGELASAVGLTNNGVRAHLQTLERAGYVRHRGSVRPGSGGGQPAYFYGLTQEALDLFSKAYEPVLGHLLDVLSEGLVPKGFEALQRDVGCGIAEGRGAPADGVRVRLEEPDGVLNELGGLAKPEERDGGYAIRGHGCPLAAATPGHPEVCRMVEALISELASVIVHERSDRGAEPRCCIEVAPCESAAQE